MNRVQRRQAGKGFSGDRVEVTGLVVHFKNGQYVNLDTSKVIIVDKHTQRPLFDEVLEAVPQAIEAGTPTANESTEEYTVQFDTPEGPMEYVKNGNWSGVRKVQR